jgi:hypothetical protein
VIAFLVTILAGVFRAQQETVAVTAAQRAAIDRGESVIVTREREESRWPAVTVYVYIESSPEEATAVFSDYASHSSYIPRVTRSAISRRIDAATVEADYVVELPVVSDEAYTVRNRLAREFDGFRIDWTLVRATSTKATSGYARFHPYVNGRSRRAGTLLEYYNFVTPASRMSGLPFIRNRAVRQVEETARAVARRVQALRADSAAIAHRVAILRTALQR